MTQKRHIEPTDEQVEGFRAWAATRPKSIQALAARFDPWGLWRNKTTRQVMVVLSFFEDGTLRVAVPSELQDELVVLSDVSVFGVHPDDLEPIDQERT